MTNRTANTVRGGELKVNSNKDKDKTANGNDSKSKAGDQSAPASSHSLMVALALTYHKAKSIYVAADRAHGNGATVTSVASLGNAKGGGTSKSGGKSVNRSNDHMTTTELDAQRIYKAAFLFCIASGIAPDTLDDMANEHNRKLAAGKQGAKEGAAPPAPAANGNRNGNHAADAAMPA